MFTSKTPLETNQSYHSKILLIARFLMARFFNSKILRVTKRLAINPKRPGRFCNFSKNWINKIKSSIFPQLRVPEKQTIARLKGLVLGFHFGQVSPLQNFSFFLRYRSVAAVPHFVRPTVRGLVGQVYEVGFC